MLFRLTALSCAFLTAGIADTLFLRSGATIQGTFAGGDARQMRIVVGNHEETYPVEEVQRLEFNDSGRYNAPSPAPAAPSSRYRVTDVDRPPAPPVTNQNYPPPPPPAYSAPPPQASYNAPPQSYSAPGEVPANTNLVIKLIDNVDSDRDRIGQTYRAAVDEPVRDPNGNILIPRGADVVAKLVNEQASGRFTGSASLTLDIAQIRVNGRMVDITSSEVTQSSASRTGRTVKTVGGGVALGAILGAVIGGGKGAAIGATTGGALGAGAQVLTKGQHVKIPSETRLSFLLQQPLRVAMGSSWSAPSPAPSPWAAPKQQEVPPAQQPVRATMGSEMPLQHLIEGNPNGQVKVLVYEDLQCPDCADFRTVMDRDLLPKYASTVMFEHHDFPLPKHSWARPAAVAARYFQQTSPALAVEFRRHLLMNLSDITPDNLSEAVAGFASKHGLDPDQAKAAMSDQRLASLVEQDFQEGIARGVKHTPTAYVGNNPFIEHITAAEISPAIEYALKMAQ